MASLDQRRPDTRTTVRSAVAQLTRELTLAGVGDAGGDVRRFLSAALGVSRAELLGAPERQVTPAELQVVLGYLDRRRRREPVSRILGERDFYDRMFLISPATLDPRPDSETIVEAALEIVRDEGWTSHPLRIVDIGTGSGCLILSLLCELPLATGLGTDISAAALEIAAQNAERLGVQDRVKWQLADGLENVAGPFHMLVANPPYIPTPDIEGLAPEVRDFDPMTALDGGPDGLSVYRRLARRLTMAVPAGWIVLEVGHDQADAVTDVLLSQIPGTEPGAVRIRCDVAGKRRCVAVRTRG